MRLITHSYDTYDHAVRALHALEAAGVPHDDISLVSGDKERSVATTVDGDTADHTGTGAGTGATLGTVLGGGAGLLAGIGSLAIPGVGPIVAAGWLIATLTGAGVGAAAGGLLGSLTGAGVDEADAKAYADHVERGGTLLTVRASDDQATQVEYILEHGEAPATTGLTAPMTATPTTATPVVAAAPVAATTTAAPAAGVDDKLQVIKEDLVVGKREVEQGAVRVTSKLVETPVEEQVRLREERVVVERRPINRPLTGAAADVFRERRLSATARSEEAVVGKEARVVEEIGLRKEASERVETVHDTVRETKVDVEQVPSSAGTTGSVTGTTGSVTGVSGTTSSTGATPQGNPALRAVDGTLGTNVSGANPDHKS
jgi:uncharacterized protein (TIGR02271 family)